ncbi:MAG: hypothetical protein F4150_07225 [Chloroflexi bacterium]|nr:hypothetical protein [Chloroflexota bacterium]
MLLVAIALVAAPATASAESGEPPGARTVTTTLRPGWTMIAWLGPDATVAELFDDIPALERVSLWDAAGRRYESWPRGRVPRDGERRLTAGAGVWLRLGGDAAVEWTRSAATGGVLLSLSAGRNLVGWLGPDGAAVGAVLARFGETLVRASRWDTQSQRYLHYRPGDPPAQNTLVELERGDGLWVELTDGARWWQGGEADVEFEAPESVPAAELARIRADLAPVLAFFAERYGIEPPDFTVAFVPELLTRLGPSVAAASPGKILIHAPSVDHVGAGALAHEYFHVLQVHLARGGPAVGSSPAWMTEGSATYAADLYLREEVRDTDAEALHRGRWRTSLGLEHMLQGYEAPEPFYAEASPTYTLGALAVEWLSGHAALSGDGGSLLSDTAWTRQLADEGAHVEYYRLLSSATEWGEALEGAFGLAPRDFYERFESYLSAVTQAILPHLGDGVDEPVVTSSPGVPAARASEFREHLRRLGSLLADHLGTRTADYTLHVAADDASASAAVGEVSREICFHR